MKKQKIDDFQFGTRSGTVGDFWVNFSAKVAIANESYNRLLKEIDELEMQAKQRLGGIPNIGNSELGHRIFVLEDIADAQLNGKDP